VGFILSIAGLLSCGLFSPLALIVSFIGLFKAPRGFAIGGTALGATGSLGLVMMLLLLILSYASYRLDMERYKALSEIQAYQGAQSVELPHLEVPELDLRAPADYQLEIRSELLDRATEFELQRDDAAAIEVNINDPSELAEPGVGLPLDTPGETLLLPPGKKLSPEERLDQLLQGNGDTGAGPPSFKALQPRRP
jgi:hypothetical protein